MIKLYQRVHYWKELIQLMVKFTGTTKILLLLKTNMWLMIYWLRLVIHFLVTEWDSILLCSQQCTLHPPIFSITQDIGLDSIYSYFDFGETYITLKGCIIDGVIYGDTTTVGVEDDQKPVLSNFRLEQNYPNPFNPSTKIKFTIPSVIASGAKQSQLATLKVYDILGNEIATLINEELSPGEYEVTFDSHSGLSGIRDLPSGVYFYQLKSGSFVQTKKMVLLK